jgi:nucleoside-diphosphate-sugar epimerase
VVVMTTSVLVAGATGDLGTRIVRELLLLDTHVRVLTRPGSDRAAEQFGSEARVDVVTAAYDDRPGGGGGRPPWSLRSPTSRWSCPPSAAPAR